MRLVLLGVMVALAGCAGQVEPEPRTVRVEVPVAVPCRAPEVPEPTWATASLKTGESLQVKVRALLAERQQHLGYEAQLRAALDACRDSVTHWAWGTSGEAVRGGLRLLQASASQDARLR